MKQNAFVALGVHLGCTFGDLNDTFEECSYGEQLYCANGIDYYIGVFFISKRSIQQPMELAYEQIDVFAGDHYRTVFT